MLQGTTKRGGGVELSSKELSNNNQFRNVSTMYQTTTGRRLEALLSHLQLIASPFVRHSAAVVQLFSNNNNNNNNSHSVMTNNEQQESKNKLLSNSAVIVGKHNHHQQQQHSDNSLLQNLLHSKSSKRKMNHNDQSSPSSSTNYNHHMDNQTFNQLADSSTRSRISGADVLLQFSPLVSGQIKQAQVTYISPHSASESADSASMQAGVLLVASTRADLRRAFIERLCQAAVERSALVYSIATQGGVNVSTDGVYKLSTHPTLSRRAILNALLRHGAHLLVFGTISTRDDVMSLMDAAYTGYHCVAEIYGESAHDALSRLEAIGVDVSMLPQNLRIVVPANTTSSLT